VLQRFVPVLAISEADGLCRRYGVASTFPAGLELVRQGAVVEIVQLGYRQLATTQQGS